jgi:hypothetical protein
MVSVKFHAHARYAGQRDVDGDIRGDRARHEPRLLARHEGTQELVWLAGDDDGGPPGARAVEVRWLHFRWEAYVGTDRWTLRAFQVGQVHNIVLAVLAFPIHALPQNGKDDCEEEYRCPNRYGRADCNRLNERSRGAARRNRKEECRSMKHSGEVKPWNPGCWFNRIALQISLEFHENQYGRSSYW